MDPRCYFVTGSGGDAPAIAAAAARGGAGLVQVRSKPLSTKELFELGRAVARAVGASNPSTKVLINDRPDVALALRLEGENVHGVHVGQDDLPVTACRALLGPDAIIGLTTGTAALVEAAEKHAEYINYVGCGPFRTTPTKNSGRTPLGVDGYADLVHRTRLPVIAIGDVTLDDVPALHRAGVAGVAVVRALMNAEDPEAYARAIVKAQS